MKITPERGVFVALDKSGNITDVRDSPAVPDATFPILAGPWPNSNVGARQARCNVCHRFVGISPRGWSLHCENPDGRPLLCWECIGPFTAHLEFLLAQGKKDRPQ